MQHQERSIGAKYSELSATYIVQQSSNMRSLRNIWHQIVAKPATGSQVRAESAASVGKLARYLAAEMATAAACSTRARKAGGHAFCSTAAPISAKPSQATLANSTFFIRPLTLHRIGRVQSSDAAVLRVARG
jgi:hypothetical protein